MNNAFENLLVTSSSKYASITINRPASHNALSLECLAEIVQAVSELSKDPNINALCITSTGKKSFAAGGDLKQFSRLTSKEDALAMSNLGRQALRAIYNFPVPTIAALNGMALGGGAELALSCDYRIFADHATLGFIQSKHAITTAWGGSYYLQKKIGEAAAFRLLAGGSILDAQAAQKLDLADIVVGNDANLEQATKHFCAAFLNADSQVLRAYKTILRQNGHGDITSSDVVEQNEFTQLWVTEKHWESVENLFKNKR